MLKIRLVISLLIIIFISTAIFAKTKNISELSDIERAMLTDTDNNVGVEKNSNIKKEKKQKKEKKKEKNIKQDTDVENMDLVLTELQDQLLCMIDNDRKYKFVAIDKEISIRNKIIFEELSKQENIDMYTIEKVFDEIKELVINKEEINLTTEKKKRYILGAQKYSNYKILQQNQSIDKNQKKKKNKNKDKKIKK